MECCNNAISPGPDVLHFFDGCVLWNVFQIVQEYAILLYNIATW